MSMRLVVAIEAHFYVVKGKAYSSYLTFESFWRRYLDVFDSVLIIGRATEVEYVPPGYQLVTERGVELAALPRYHGPYQFIVKWLRIRRIISEFLRDDDAIILRVPGNVGTQVWKLLEHGRPYGLEVIGDPLDAFAPGSIHSVIRPYARWSWTQNLKAQCKGAAAVAYVTEHVLQQRYPPSKDAFTTHYSSIDIDTAKLCSDISQRLETISAISKRLAGKGGPVRLGFVGTFSQTHKLPHIHIKALAECVGRGANLTLDMIGDGVLLEDMKALAQKLGVAERVKFRGRLPGGKAILDAMDSFDLFLNAVATEGLPRVVIEAMSRGCPCIASNVGGTPELLEQSYLVPPADVNALAETILHVLADPKSMAKTVERNLRIARDYCADKIQPRRQAFYAALCERTEKYLSKKL
jgi:glycosyltransferase involved in cell wall biosynthesis